MVPQQMDVTVLHPAGKDVHVLVSGELDLSTVGRLSDTLANVLAQQPDLVQVDLSAVTFFSCAAAHELWRAHQHTAIPVNVVAARPPVQRLLHIMQLQPLLAAAVAA